MAETMFALVDTVESPDPFLGPITDIDAPDPPGLLGWSGDTLGSGQRMVVKFVGTSTALSTVASAPTVTEIQRSDANQRWRGLQAVTADDPASSFRVNGI